MQRIWEVCVTARLSVLCRNVLDVLSRTMRCGRTVRPIPTAKVAGSRMHRLTE